jgi:hypothetical protein
MTAKQGEDTDKSHDGQDFNRDREKGDYADNPQPIH